MTDTTNINQQGTLSVEALFKAASQSEPELSGTNFTKVVLNRLPHQAEKAEKAQWLPDLVGIVVALIAIWLVVEPANLFKTLSTSVPESVTISVPNMLVVSLSLIVVAAIGWWIVEREA